jgi:hypothetical protein
MCIKQYLVIISENNTDVLPLAMNIWNSYTCGNRDFELIRSVYAIKGNFKHVDRVCIMNLYNMIHHLISPKCNHVIIYLQHIINKPNDDIKQCSSLKHRKTETM